MNEAEPDEHVMNEAMPPFPMRRATLAHGNRCGEYGYPPMKAFMFDNIKPGDKVQVWIPVTHVDGDNITLAELITTGRESIVGHKPKDRTLDEEWAALTEHEKQMLIQRHYESMGR